VNGLGFSALLLGMLGRRPGLDHDPARHEAALRRLAVMLGLNLALILAAMLAQR
jgi:hypothetical protein